MALDQFVTALDSMLEEARACLSQVQSAEELEQLRVKYTGAKSGALKSVQKLLGSIGDNDKPVAGKKFNEVRDGIEGSWFRPNASRVTSSSWYYPSNNPNARTSQRDHGSVGIQCNRRS
jgi:phenylalanyl-tRNA synthetase alpha chain